MNVAPYLTLGRLLAHHRSARSQDSVADTLGISRSTLSHIERGHILPSGKTLARLLYLYATDGNGPKAPAGQQLAIFRALTEAGGVA